MAIEDDVLVIGGGLAGTTAALAAAETGATVRLLSYKQSTLRHASGLIDVLGYAPDGAGPLPNPFDAIPALPDGHPYQRVGVDGVREALAFFDDVAGDAYRGGHTETNALVPTTGGTVKPTARYPAGTAAGLASDPRSTLLVGFETLPEFDAPLAAAHLEAAGVPFDVRGVTLRFPGDLRDGAKVTRYARALDRDEALPADRAGGRGLASAEGSIEADGGTGPAREALAESVRERLDGEDRVGFPPVLGDEFHEAVRDDLAERIGADVFEVPSGPPSLPGMRLEDLLYDALEEAGVRVTTGVPVVDFETEAGASETSATAANADGAGGAGRGDERATERIDHVLVDRKGNDVPYRADEYVLATGGLVGKGVRSDREGVFEPIFGCHVDAPRDRTEWSESAAFGDHAFTRFGVAVDRELRPLAAGAAVESGGRSEDGRANESGGGSEDGGAEGRNGGGEGEPEFENLRAAGAVLGGYDYAAEKSGAGVSLATGYAAGRLAGEGVTR